MRKDAQHKRLRVKNPRQRAFAWLWKIRDKCGTILLSTK
jgi:hypothetical protein